MTTFPDAIADARASERALLEQAFSRAAGGPLVTGNAVRLLRNAAENYPAWLDAIAAATRTIDFETYIIWDDAAGATFADALSARAREGVRVRVLYDWLGGIGKTPQRFWDSLIRAGVEVRAFNPFRVASPLGWLHRDHRKSLVIDGIVGFVSGLCVGQQWVGYPARGVSPWRDTGLEVRGPAVDDIAMAFARAWTVAGGENSPATDIETGKAKPAGNVAVRVIASEPWSARMIRLAHLMASAARERWWLTDAYFAGTPEYVQALRAAARDDVDVRLLVPGTTDIPVLQAFTRAGYRPLLEAGVRVFEWRGSMLHAKTAVGDDEWARVGSSNLNIASWIGNWELDVAVNDKGFAERMAAMFLEDLEGSTEIVLSEARVTDRRRVPRMESTPRRRVGSAGRIAAGAVRIGNTASAMLTEHRVLGATEARAAAALGGLCVTIAGIMLLWPRLLAIPFGIIIAWIGVAMLAKAHRLRREREERGERRTRVVEADAGGNAHRLAASPNVRAASSPNDPGR
ncbi:MAG TPA: phospholipase D-like domain-containing protein [Gemmatimonadaceae bacterium]|nr:phospholipase D-like domain-containing protein [Gemmatimonadaceae bacterium]